MLRFPGHYTRTPECNVGIEFCDSGFSRMQSGYYHGVAGKLCSLSIGRVPWVIVTTAPECMIRGLVPAIAVLYEA